MKEVTAYRCDYCKKLYMRSGTCANHEELCLKNPQNIPLCYTCKHFIPSYETDFMSLYDNLGYEDTQNREIRVQPHRCELIVVKLYRLTTSVLENMQEAFSIAGYIPMPTLSFKCNDYKIDETTDEDNEDKGGEDSHKRD